MGVCQLPRMRSFKSFELFTLFVWAIAMKGCFALSNFTILGGDLANTMINAPRADSAGRSLIDWDIIVMMEPSTIGGTVLGSFASKYLLDFVLMVSVASVLSALAFRTLDKGWAMFLRGAEGTEGSFLFVLVIYESGQDATRMSQEGPAG